MTALKGSVARSDRGQPLTENPRAASEGEGRSKSPPGTREEEGWTQLGRTGRILWSWRPESDAWGARSQEVVGREDAGSAAAQPRPSGPVTRGACKASLSGGPGASTETVRNQRWGHVSEHVCSQLPLVTILVTTMGGRGNRPTALRSKFGFRDVNCCSQGHTAGERSGQGWGWAHRKPGPTRFHVATRRRKLRRLIKSGWHQEFRPNAKPVDELKAAPAAGEGV